MKTTLFSLGPLPLLVLAASFAAGCGSEGGGNNSTDASTSGSGGAASGSSVGSGGSASSSSGSGGAAPASSTSASSGSGGGPAGSCFSDYLTKAVYESLFPHRNALYEYDDLVAAAQAYPAFCTEGTPDDQRREVAAFLANISHETTGGWDAAPDGRFAWGLVWTEELACADNPEVCDYCQETNLQYPCADQQYYHGRGPIQLSWNYNYGQAGDALGENLLAAPDLVLSSGVIAFKTALWFWMTAQPPKPSAHDVMTGQWTPSPQDEQLGRVPGFGMTINIINGGLECGKQSPDVDDRVGFYMTFTTAFAVAPGPNLYCDQMTPY